MKLAIIDYGAGNVQSVTFALERLGIQPVLTNRAEEIISADKVLFPGVGAAGAAMARLNSLALTEVIRNLTQPVLGICLGMQLMCSHSEENDTPCLGIFPQQVKLFRGNEKVPQIGWNNITDLQTPLFDKVEEQAYVYFVHSFYVEKSSYTIATADYMLEYAAAIHRENFYATQFHPEKSGKTGEQILKNFLEL